MDKAEVDRLVSYWTVMYGIEPAMQKTLRRSQHARRIALDLMLKGETYPIINANRKYIDKSDDLYGLLYAISGIPDKLAPIRIIRVIGYTHQLWVWDNTAPRGGQYGNRCTLVNGPLAPLWNEDATSC